MSKIHKDYKSLSSKDKQKITQGSIIPRPIAWVSTINENDSINLAPFSYFAQLSATLVAISFTKPKEGHKHTYRNIMRTHEAVIHLGDVGLLKALDKTSASLPYNESELDGLNLTLKESDHIKTPYIDEALISFEVKLERELEFMSDDYSKVDNNVVFLRILSVHLDDSVYDSETGYIDAKVLRPISRLSGSDYATIKPLNFKREF